MCLFPVSETEYDGGDAALTDTHIHVEEGCGADAYLTFPLKWQNQW